MQSLRPSRTEHPKLRLARAEAIIEAHRLAFNRLMTGWYRPNSAPASCADARGGGDGSEFGIDEEKTSRVRYIGSLSFQFRRAEVRRFLIRAGAVLRRRNPNRCCCCRYWFRAAPNFYGMISILVLRPNAVPPSSGLYLAATGRRSGRYQGHHAKQAVGSKTLSIGSAGGTAPQRSLSRKRWFQRPIGSTKCIPVPSVSWSLVGPYRYTYFPNSGR